MSIHQVGQVFLLLPNLTIHSSEQYFRLALQQQKRVYTTTNYIIVELVALLNNPLRVSRSRIFEIVNAIKTVTYVEVVHIDSRRAISL